jgi:hypothetical protein
MAMKSLGKIARPVPPLLVAGADAGALAGAVWAGQRPTPISSVARETIRLWRSGIMR